MGCALLKGAGLVVLASFFILVFSNPLHADRYRIKKTNIPVSGTPQPNSDDPFSGIDRSFSGKSRDDVARESAEKNRSPAAADNSGISNHEKLKQALKVAPFVKDAFSIQKTPNGVRYFVGSFGACACATDNLQAQCVKDLASELTTAVKAHNEQAKTVCPPNAGCTLGIRLIYVECPDGGTDSLGNY